MFVVFDGEIHGYKNVCFEFSVFMGSIPKRRALLLAAAYRVEVAKMTAAPLVGKFGVKAGGVSNAIRAVLLVF